MPQRSDSAHRGVADPLADGQAGALPYGLGHGKGLPGSGYPSHPLQGMSRLFTQMFLMWRDLLGPLVPPDGRWDPEAAGYNARPESDYGAPREPDYVAPREPDYGASRSRARVTFDITAAKRVEVSLTLDLEQDLTALVVLDLIAVVDAAERGAASKDGRPPPMHDVVLERTGDGGVVVRMTVPAKQPAGTYLGLIVDRARAEPRGDVRVRIQV